MYTGHMAIITTMANTICTNRMDMDTDMGTVTTRAAKATMANIMILKATTDLTMIMKMVTDKDKIRTITPEKVTMTMTIKDGKKEDLNKVGECM